MSLVNKDLITLTSLLRDENDDEYFGPLKKNIIDKDFNEVFPEELIRNILKHPIQCSPAGYRGFYMGTGQIWFDNYKGTSLN